MSLELLEVINDKKPQGEVVRLQAKSDLNLSGYAIVDRTFVKDKKVSNEFRHIFVFPDTEVEEGEYVRLHTGAGKYKRAENTNGTVTHHFYWGSGDCVWNNNGEDVATLISYKRIAGKEVPAV